MSPDLSFWHLLLEASFVVQLVMLLLFVISVFSWTFIFQRAQMLRRTKATLGEFNKAFHSGLDLGSLYSKLAVKEQRKTGLETIFVAGFKEFVKMHGLEKASPQVIIEASKRSMQMKLSKEATKLEKHLPFLATVQSMSPYIGLFGTVWGIMHAFRQLGMVQQATLSMVAPGIAEALIATAMGLVAAIPAGIAYNRYINKVDDILRHYEGFIEEFTCLLTRKLYANKESNSEVK